MDTIDDFLCTVRLLQMVGSNHWLIIGEWHGLVIDIFLNMSIFNIAVWFGNNLPKGECSEEKDFKQAQAFGGYILRAKQFKNIFWHA